VDRQKNLRSFCQSAARCARTAAATWRAPCECLHRRRWDHLPKLSHGPACGSRLYVIGFRTHRFRFCWAASRSASQREVRCCDEQHGRRRLRGPQRVDTVEKGFTEVGLPAPVRKGFLCHRLGCNYDSPTARDRNWILSDHISSVLRSTFSTASVKHGHQQGLKPGPLYPQSPSSSTEAGHLPRRGSHRRSACRNSPCLPLTWGWPS
jgi:hypothetical protein